jgi:hypothetical protein
MAQENRLFLRTSILRLKYHRFQICSTLFSTGFFVVEILWFRTLLQLNVGVSSRALRRIFLSQRKKIKAERLKMRSFVFCIS